MASRAENSRGRYGMDWHGQKVRQTGVLYIVGEGASGIQQRIEGWHMHYGIQCRNAPFMVLFEAVHLLKPENVRRLKRAIDRAQRLCGFEIGLVIIDTVSRAIPGTDENATEVMTALVQACDDRGLPRNAGTRCLQIADLA